MSGGYDPDLLAGLRVPPQSREAEEAVLGSLLIAGAHRGRYRAAMDRLEWLQPEHFHEAGYAMIWRRMRELHAVGEVADPVTLAHWARAQPELECAPHGAKRLLAGLARAAETIVNVEDYARLVVECAVRRGLIALAQDLIAEAFDPNSERGGALGAQAIRRIEAVLASDGSVARGKTFRQVAQALAARLDQGPRSCWPTGLQPLDQVLAGGLYARKLYGVGAFQKTGKTSLLGTIALHQAEACVPVLYVAGEMDDVELVERMIGARYGFNSLAFLRERPGEAVVQAVVDAATRGPDSLIFEYVPGLTFTQLQGLFAHYAASGRVKGVIVDYWQLVGGIPRGTTKVDHRDTVAQWLADAAGRHDVWVLTAAQLNREGDTRDGDGLKNSASCYLTLHACEDDDPTKGAYLTMDRTRYTPKEHAGSKSQPALRLDVRVGPRFVEFHDTSHPAQAGVAL